MEGGSELNKFLEVWIIAIASLCYCYFLSRRISIGCRRLFSIIPVLSLFALLPLRLSSVHLGGPTAFYLSWLANFKLLLFSLGTGPLSPAEPLSLVSFLAVAALPVKISRRRGLSSGPRALPIKAAILAVVMCAYAYRPYLRPYAVRTLYCCHMYLAAELLLALSAAPVRAWLGLDIEPQFREPYLATSLQDFWGRRWNLMVSGILRPAVYDPIRRVYTPSMGATLARLTATMAAFAVSGLMHEVIFFYLTRANPTGEVTCFFLLHGMCTAAETVVKKAAADRKFRLHRAVSGPLTVGFVTVTACWLFLPQILRNQVEMKTMRESRIAAAYLVDLTIRRTHIG